MTDDGAVEVLNVRQDFGDAFAEVRAWRVPESDRYPEGVKYAFQYGREDGTTVFRYDNFPDHSGADRHHKHTVDGDVVGVDFEGLEPLFERFKTEIHEHGNDWN